MKNKLKELYHLDEFLLDDSDLSNEDIKKELLELGINPDEALSNFKSKFEKLYWEEVNKERVLKKKANENNIRELLTLGRSELEKTFNQLINSSGFKKNDSLLAFREREPSEISDDELREMISNIKDLLDENHST